MSEAFLIAAGVIALLALHSIVPAVLVGAVRRSTSSFAFTSLAFVALALGLHFASPYGMIDLGRASGVMSWVPAACVASSIAVVGVWACIAKPPFAILVVAAPVSFFLFVVGSYIY